MMNLRPVILFFALTLLLSCGKNDEISIPSGILTQEQMVSVLVDFHLAEAAVFDVQRNRGDVGLYTGRYYTAILKNHGIDRKKFGESVYFYSQHIDEFKKIYEQVLTVLSTKQSEVLSVKSL